MINNALWVHIIINHAYKELNRAKDGKISYMIWDLIKMLMMLNLYQILIMLVESLVCRKEQTLWHFGICLIVTQDVQEYQQYQLNCIMSVKNKIAGYLNALPSKKIVTQRVLSMLYVKRLFRYVLRQINWYQEEIKDHMFHYLKNFFIVIKYASPLIILNFIKNINAKCDAVDW